MIRRVVSLVFGLLAIVACSMDIDPQVTAVRSPPTSGSSPPSRRTPDPPPEPSARCPVELVLTEADLDKDVGWKPAKSNPGACSATDLSTLEANFKSTNIKTYFDLGVGLPEACFACVFSKDTDASWGVIVGTAENNGETGFVNVGACAAVVGGEPCGKARLYEELCFVVACNECTTTSTEREACTANAKAGGMCTTFASKVVGACADAGAGCGTPIYDARTLCGPPKDEDAGM